MRRVPSTEVGLVIPAGLGDDGVLSDVVADLRAVSGTPVAVRLASARSRTARFAQRSTKPRAF